MRMNALAAYAQPLMSLMNIWGTLLDPARIREGFSTALRELSTIPEKLIGDP
jgi:hypothetical protein